MSAGILTADESFFIGKCQSCRHAEQAQHERAPGLVLICKKDDGHSTKPHWQCGKYEYEPGSLG